MKYQLPDGQIIEIHDDVAPDLQEKEADMNTKEQTELLDKLRELLQSIAIMAVRAQENVGNHDFVSDALVDIDYDISKADSLNQKLIDLE
jgi:hypothetical protein